MTKEEKEKWVRDYFKKYNEDIEKRNEIMSGTKYIKWLIQFTEDKEGFSDEDWLYFPDEINDTDRSNVEMLRLFYEGIEEYANNNYIYPTPCDFGNYYKVKFNKFGFEIGVLAGQGTVFFCNKAPIENEKDFIDFYNVMIGKKQNNTDQIRASLDSLSQMVIATYENGVPIEAIINTLDDTIENITLKREDKSKKLLKNK